MITDVVLDEVVEKIVDRVIDQCVITVDMAVEEIGDEYNIPLPERRSNRLLEAIDAKVFECNCCGWYCSTDELNNDNGDDRCDDCTGSDEDEGGDI